MLVNLFLIDKGFFDFLNLCQQKNGGNMTQTTIKYLKKGEFFRFKNDENSPLWVRSEYNRTDKKYECYKYDDTNHCLFCNSDRKVWI